MTAIYCPIFKLSLPHYVARTPLDKCRTKNKFIRNLPPGSESVLKFNSRGFRINSWYEGNVYFAYRFVPMIGEPIYSFSGSFRFLFHQELAFYTRHHTNLIHLCQLNYTAGTALLGIIWHWALVLECCSRFQRHTNGFFSTAPSVSHFTLNLDKSCIRQFD